MQLRHHVPFRFPEAQDILSVVSAFLRMLMHGNTIPISTFPAVQAIPTLTTAFLHVEI